MLSQCPQSWKREASGHPPSHLVCYNDTDYRSLRHVLAQSHCKLMEKSKIFGLFGIANTLERGFEFRTVDTSKSGHMKISERE